jgi:hypothetical protein
MLICVNVFVLVVKSAPMCARSERSPRPSHHEHFLSGCGSEALLCDGIVAFFSEVRDLPYSVALHPTVTESDTEHALGS